MNGLTYLASPYSDGSADVREKRFLAALDAAARLMADGHVVFSPIAHSHPLAVRHELPGDWAYWETFDRAILSSCARVVVLRLAGWEESRGISHEIRIATELGLAVEYVDP